ncbi:hypothetical protein PVAG01_04003 [Phlyctema vagabunda]|uniref:Uncharacterized protein n=1 Tax=Phlyctema vagabunda TaxID=108571 RepID=A0ABR4PN01_9HELO
MAKTPQDVADLLDIPVDPFKAKLPEGGYATALTDHWGDISVGTLDPEDWNTPASATTPDEGATKQMRADIRAAYEKIKGLAKRYHERVNITQISDLRLDGKQSVYAVFDAVFRGKMEDYMTQLESSPVHTLSE